MKRTIRNHRTVLYFGIISAFTLGLITLSILVGNAQVQTTGESLSGVSVDNFKDPAYLKFDSQLVRVLEVSNKVAKGNYSAQVAESEIAEIMRVNSLPIYPGKVEVWIKYNEASSINESELLNLGVEKDDHFGIFQNFVQALIPVSSLHGLGEIPTVFQISISPTGHPTVISEGVGRVNAQNFTNAGFRGQSVKVAILDLGFANYTSLLGSELPTSVTARSFYNSTSGNGDITGGGEKHGTACAEIVHDMAPDAQLYLVNYRSVSDMNSAVQYLKAQGVKVITHSIGFTNASFYDGHGQVSDIVADARSSGILWVNSAGNSALQHWEGFFSDSDGNGFNNFSSNPLDETIDLTVPANELIDVALTWDDWNFSTNDYDLYLYFGSPLQEVSSSRGFQTGLQDPTERVVYTATQAGTYHIVIKRPFFASTSLKFELFVHTTNDRPLAEYRVKSTSLLDPAPSASSFTAGAMRYTDSTIESFSSLGPTTRGARKPDLTGPDGVSTGTYGSGGFFGTSASAPHVAGAAALFWSQNSSRTAADIQSLLQTNAIDFGVTGADNTYGFGMLNLPVFSSGITVGQGAPNPQLFTNAFNRNGFSQFVQLPPLNAVHRWDCSTCDPNNSTWGKGLIQDFNDVTSGVHDALMVADNNTNFVAQIYGAMWDKLNQLGGLNYSSSNTRMIGYPIADRNCSDYNATCFAQSALHSPFGTQYDYQRFQGGAFVLHRSGAKNTQTFEVHGPIRARWQVLNGPDGSFGLPISDEYSSSGKRKSDFEGGSICYNPATGQTEDGCTTISPPFPPTANAATNVTSSSFMANWGSSSGATGYRLDVSTSSSFGSFVSGYQNLDVGNVLSRSVTGLTAGINYYYRVRAYNSTGISGNSNTINLTTGISPPSAPTANSATSVTSSSFTANWGSSSGATGYRLDVSTSSSFGSFVSGYQNLDVGNVLSRSVTGLTAGINYYYRVRAYNSTGISGNSNTINLTTGISPPSAPTANSATSVTSSSFTANWGSSSGATGYRLDVSTSSSFGSFISGYQNLDVGNVLSRSITGLNASTPYFYRLRAYNGGGTSGNSNTINLTTAANPPPTRSLTVASSNPSSGVNITVSPNDNNGQGSGTTQFTRVYNNNTNMSLTAPSTAGGNNFQKWQLDGIDLTTSLLANFVMDSNHTITAVYVSPPTRTLTVASSNPSSGVSITVGPNDNNGQGSGTTQFSRVYNNNTNMTLTAPSTAGGNAFQKWQLDGVDLTTSLLANFVMDANHTITAVYMPGSTGGNAIYDAVLKAPKCGQPGSTCDSGTLLNGRDNFAGGPEPNQPNTINNSCSDGSGGAYHSDESLDAIKVSTLDGSNFAPGKTVRIDATVWAWTDPSVDHLDLYYAADANNPNWIYIAALQPAVVGSQVLSTIFVLPTGGTVQAVRAVFRFQGTASSCSSNSTFDDYDDLIMAVGAGGTATNFAKSANGGIASASSTTPNAGFPGYNFVPSTATDGDRKSGVNFWRDDTANAYPDWLQVDFNGPKNISEIDLFTMQDNDQSPSDPTLAMTFVEDGITVFDVQYWNGSAWVTVTNGSVSGNNRVWRQFTFSSVTTSKVRVLINNALNTRSRVVELEAWGEATAGNATNQALSANGGTMSASSTTPNSQFPGYNFLPSVANDGDRKSGVNFWRDDTANAYPDWLQVDFNGPKGITEIDVFTMQDNDQNPLDPTLGMTFLEDGIVSFDVQYWNGSVWVNVPNGSVTGNNKVWRQFAFSAIITNKVRVLVNNALNSRSRVVELEAWGTSNSSPNQALAANGAVASASSTTPNSQFPGYNFLPGVANDGDRKSGVNFWRDNTANTYPDWLQIDFNGTKNISEIDVFTMQDNDQNPSDPTLGMTFIEDGITSFEVQYWTGDAWLTVPNGSVTGNNKVWRQFTFSPIATGKIRVLVSNALNSRSRIVELEAY